MILVSSDRIRLLKCYEIGRTAHFERLHASSSQLLYRRSSYDCDILRAPIGTVRQASRREMLRSIRDLKPTTVEVNEPLQISAWLTVAIVQLAALSIRRSGRPEIVTYAIENADIGASLASRLRLPEWLARWVVRIVAGTLFRGISRVCFGTQGAQDNYAQLLRERDMKHASIKVEPALPSPASSLSSRPPESLLFVGALENRKGIVAALDACKIVRRDRPVSLTVIGNGPLAPFVEGFAQDNPWVRYEPSLPREKVLEEYLHHKVLILFSQRTEEWREQVGLPILEGVARGLEVVASTETGLAEWLKVNGHRVLDPQSPTTSLALELERALDSERRAETVVSMLPKQDGRALAERWLMASVEGRDH